MYGTVAKMKAIPGSDLIGHFQSQMADELAAGMVSAVVYRMDTDPDEYMMAVVFQSKDAYVSNANSPEMHARYEAYRALLAEEPEWHDGEVVEVEGSIGA